jgi:nucleotide-binding universal stress UspA family protein
MGEFLLAMAQERAEKAGVKAGAIVREGLFNQVLIDVIREYQVTSVVLGSSSGETAILTDEYVDRLVQDVRGETGVEFIIVSSGEVVNVHSKDE